jgi:hypothetical protein
VTGVLFLVGCNPLCLDSPCDLSVRHRVSAACIAPHGYFLRSAVSHPMNIQGCYDLKTHRPPDMGYGNSNLIYQCFISSSRLVAHALQSIRPNRCMGPYSQALAPVISGSYTYVSIGYTTGCQNLPIECSPRIRQNRANF